MNGMYPRLPISIAALVLSAAAFCLPSAMAQQDNPDAGFVATQPKKPKVESVQSEKPAPYDRGGVVAQAFKIKKPLELINPLAPAKDGQGSDDISWDPDNPEKPKGIILFGIQW